MSVFNRTEEEFTQWVCEFADDRLLEELHLMETLLDDDTFRHCILVDLGTKLLEAMKEEVVNRFEKTTEKGGA